MKHQTKINYLEKARDVIADKDSWCQGHSAVDEDGEPCMDPKDSNAVRFCAMGAVEKVVRKSVNFYSNVSTLEDLLDDECPDNTGNSVVGVNDRSSAHAHRSVMGVFNRAIKKLQRRK